jgi:hypothetical protein
MESWMRLPPVEEAAQTAATATTFTLGFALAAEEAAAAFGRRVAVAPPVARAVAPAAASDDDDVEMTKEVCELSVSSSRSRVQTVRTDLPPVTDRLDAPPAFHGQCGYVGAPLEM